MKKFMTLLVAVLALVAYLAYKAKSDVFTPPVILDLEDTEPVVLEESDLALDPEQEAHEPLDEEMDGIEIKGEGDPDTEDPLYREV